MEEKFRIQISLVDTLTRAVGALRCDPGTSHPDVAAAYAATATILEAACQKASVLAATATATDVAPTRDPVA